jgi:hypothetical protein
VLIYLRGLGFPTDRRPPDAEKAGEKASERASPWGKPK